MLLVFLSGNAKTLNSKEKMLFGGLTWNLKFETWNFFIAQMEDNLLSR